MTLIGVEKVARSVSVQARASKAPTVINEVPAATCPAAGVDECVSSTTAREFLAVAAA
jgi:hypothetical protein